jgi:hypothetical protein
MQWKRRKIANLWTRIIESVRIWVGLDRPIPDLEGFRTDATAASALLAEPVDDITRLFLQPRGRLVDKWMHYLPVYDRHLTRYRNTPFGMLEIGVFQGGSLMLWREYFGERLELVGIDIDPNCATRVDPPNRVRIGSQGDPAFLRQVASEMSRLDVVLDDGSHVAEHVWTSFSTLFPLLSDGGIYIIEDCHTSYWRHLYDGGYRRSGTAIELVKQMIDDLHHWYHGRPFATAARSSIGAIHVYDSIIVIEKATPVRPMRTTVGP